MTENFAEIFKEDLVAKRIDVGTLIEGVVIDITNNNVIVNAGLKSEGIIPIEQFTDSEGELEVGKGDTVVVAVDSLEDGYGETALSREHAKAIETWRKLEDAYKSKETVQGILQNRVKGGFIVTIEGVNAFLPGSLADLQPVRELDHLEGKTLDFKLIKLDRHRNNIVVSRRAVLETENTFEREELLKNIKEGAVVKGIVKNITDYGAFIGFNGFDGLLHITDMAWRRVRHPSEVLKIGDDIEVKVLKCDKSKNRISLGLKQMSEDPWNELLKRFPVGTRTPGRVTSVTDYGCFVEIGENVEGLVHVSEMDWINKNINAAKAVSVDDEIEVMVLDVDEEKRRISLGIKQCKPNPWKQFSEAHAVGSKIKGKIKSINDFGIFVGLEGFGIDGLVHINDISNTEAPDKAIRKCKKGDEIEAVVNSIDVERGRASLSIKQLQDNPIGDYLAKHPKNTVIKGTVAEMANQFIIVNLAEHVRGKLLHSELALSKEEQEEKLASIKVGDAIEAKITNLDKKNLMINLSVKKKEKDEQAELTKEYTKTSLRTSIGDRIKNLFAKISN